MKNTSLWKEDAVPVRFPSLQKDISVDVAIVGGGITGITAAYLLSKQGKKVAVLEAGEVAGGTTGFSTGNLYATIDEQFHKIRSKFDKETALEVATSRTAAVNMIESIIGNFNIDCNFQRCPWYLFSETENTTINKEYEAAHEAGLAVEKINEIPLLFPVNAAIKLENQAQFNPYRYVKALAAAIAGADCQIFENTKVIDFEYGKPNILYSTGAKVTAQYIIHATHVPKGVLPVQTLLGPYREYALAVKLKRGIYPRGIFWGINEGHHYSIRSYQSDSGEEYLLILGEPHKVGQKENNEACFIKLEKYIREHFDVDSVTYFWGAQHYKAADGLPYIGKMKKDSDVYYATGFSTDGLTYGTLSAMLISDAIHGRDHVWAKIYDSLRFDPVKSAPRFIKENINVMGQYLKDFPFKEDVKAFAEINRGEGKLIEVDGKKYAAYRDEKDNIQVVSAVCTHMKCIVHFNKAEKSWDCPCHGSRFSVDGKVIEGPAISDLQNMYEEGMKKKAG